MRIMKTIKNRPLVGDECWIVEWCSKLAFYPNDDGTDSTDVDHDACTITERRVQTREQAEALAKRVWQETAQHTFGIVEYAPHRFVPYDEADVTRYPWAGFWEATDDSEVYAGDEP